MAPRRTRSEMDLFRNLDLNNGPYPEGEFYTAVGPDGKRSNLYCELLRLELWPYSC